MKRFIAMLLILCSALLMTAAFAEEAAPEAKITVVEQRFINMEDNGRGFFFAKVQNTGDAAGYADYKGNIVLFDAEGNIILTENYVHTKPSDVYLEPGEYAYVCESIYDDALDTAEVADCQFSIKAVDDGEEYEKLASEAKIHFEPDEEDDNYVDVTFKIDPRTKRIIMMGAMDTLVKGAAGQAVQNMNLLFGFDEAEGLNMVPMFP